MQKITNYTYVSAAVLESKDMSSITGSENGAVCVQKGNAALSRSFLFNYFWLTGVLFALAVRSTSALSRRQCRTFELLVR